jgi:hypothetical protein
VSYLTQTAVSQIPSYHGTSEPRTIRRQHRKRQVLDEIGEKCVSLEMAAKSQSVSGSESSCIYSKAHLTYIIEFVVSDGHGFESSQVENGSIGQISKERKVVCTSNGVSGVNTEDIPTSCRSLVRQLLDQRNNAWKRSVLCSDSSDVWAYAIKNGLRHNGSGKIQVQFVQITVVIVDMDDTQIGLLLGGNALENQGPGSEGEEVRDLHYDSQKALKQ